MAASAVAGEPKRIEIPSGKHGLDGFRPTEAQRDRMRAEVAARETQRAHPDSRRARLASRTAFRSLSASEAVFTARQKHSDIIGKPGWRPFKPREKERILRYTAPDQAELDTPRKGKTRVESTLPLRTKDEDGKLVPVDVTLKDSGVSFEPRAPLARLRIGKQLGDGVALEGTGISVVATGPATGEAQLVEGKPFWSNVATDTDYFLRVQPEGVESLWQLRSQDSPEELRLRFELPSGASLREAKREDGPGGTGSLGTSVEVVRDGHVLTHVSAPLTVDAEKWPLPTTMRVDGDSVIVSVKHQGRDVAYPLLVDPIMAVTEKYWAFNDGNHWWNDFDGWSWAALNGIHGSVDPYIWTAGFVGYPNYPARPGRCYNDDSINCGGAWGRGLYTQPWNDLAVGLWDWAQWMFVAGNGGSGINVERTELYSTFAWETTNGRFSTSQGLANWANWVSAWTTSGWTVNDYRTYCTPYRCDVDTNGQDAIAAVSQIWANTGSAQARNLALYLRSGWVVINDYAAPSGPSLSHQNLPGGWVENASPSVNASASDGGVGVQTFALYRQRNNDARADIDVRNYGCSATRHGWCPPSWSASFSYGTTGLPDGDYTFSMRAMDAWGSLTPHSEWHVKVDRTAPAIDVDGDVRAAEGFGWLSGGNHEVWVEVDDYDDQGFRASGAKRVELLVDGIVRGTRDFDCAQECPASAEHGFDFDADAYSSGQHTVEVRATDALGHLSSESWTVDIDNEAPTATQSGTLATAAALQTANLGAPSYQLLTVAQDGGPLQPQQSGVARISISVDGWLADEAEQVCEDGSCSMNHLWTYQNQDFGAGVHTVTATVTDVAGNESTHSLVVSDGTSMDCNNVLASPSGQPCFEKHWACSLSQEVVPGPSNPAALPSDVITPSAALSILQATMPSVVTPSVATTLNGLTVRPSLDTSGPDHVVTGAQQHGALPEQPAGGLAIGWGPDGVCLHPLATDTAATQPLLVAGDSILLANTQPAVDTVMRPTAYGVEAFLQLRNARAPETFRWKVGMPEGATLQQLDPRTVAVVGPEDPYDVDGPQPSIPAPATASDQTKIPHAQTQLTDGVALLDAADWLTGERTRAVIRAPWAKAADGVDVPISLTANPDGTVSLTVSHRTSGIAYPVIADPEASSRPEVRTTTWNYGVRNTGAQYGTRTERNNDLKKHGSKVIALQDICYEDGGDVLTALGGPSKFRKRSEKLWTPTENGRAVPGACTRSNIFFISKDYPVSDAGYRTFQVYISGREPASGSRPAPCHYARRATAPKNGWPRCIQRFPVRVQNGDVTFFNAHYGRHYRGAPRSKPAYGYIANRVAEASGPRKVIGGDFNAVHANPSQRELMDPLYGPPLDFFEIDRTKNRGTFWNTGQNAYIEKRDYMFYGHSPSNWTRAVIQPRGFRLSDHLALRARLFAPR